LTTNASSFEESLVTISHQSGSVDGLGQADVDRLLADDSPTVRAEIAGKVAQAFTVGAFGDEERKIGEEIFRRMIHDAAVSVRQALAENLKKSKDLPRDIAMALARDVDAVSLPILGGSAVLTDDDLLQLIDRVNHAGKLAIAGREQVSPVVSDKLVSSDDAPVVATLFSNPGAVVTGATMERAVARVGSDEHVQGALVRRHDLPITIAEKLVALVSANLRDYLVTHHELPADMAADLIIESRERATTALLPEGSDNSQDSERLVAQLYQNGRLTTSLVFRSLCLGDISFFESSVALLAKLPIVNARLLIHDEGPLGLKAVYKQSGLPAGLYPAFRIAFDTVREVRYDGEAHDRERLVRRVLERMLTRYEDFEPEDLDYLLRKLDQYAGTA
jgi:uncharacterized protein (DUF2336 family)